MEATENRIKTLEKRMEKAENKIKFSAFYNKNI